MLPAWWSDRSSSAWRKLVHGNGHWAKRVTGLSARWMMLRIKAKLGVITQHDDMVMAAFVVVIVVAIHKR